MIRPYPADIVYFAFCAGWLHSVLTYSKDCLIPHTARVGGFCVHAGVVWRCLGRKRAYVLASHLCCSSLDLRKETTLLFTLTRVV